MIRFRALPAAFFCVAAAMLQTACEKRIAVETGPDGKPVKTEKWAFLGQPDPAKKWKAPSEITDFDTLYTQNCLACHGRGETLAAAISMDDQTYLNIVPADVLKNVIANGVEGARMPGFALSAGGHLTDEQVEILAKGILAWKKPLDPSMGPLPSYSAPPGNAANGRTLFEQSFAKGLPPEKTYLDPGFLGLVSDQYLRSLVIAGLPGLGYPDYRSFIPGRTLSDQDVSDIVAYLVSNRQNEYGQPLVMPSLPTEPPVTHPGVAQ